MTPLAVIIAVGAATFALGMLVGCALGRRRRPGTRGDWAHVHGGHGAQRGGRHRGR
ncbi:MAG: hypothetical protein ACRDQ0_22130 [Pseudonocardia sp.]